jgi:hypothetical protein
MQVSSQAKTGNLAMSANPLQISRDSSHGHYFERIIDEVRIYNQELLPSEIVADLQTPVTRSIVATYGSHKPAGSTVADASGNTNTGMLSSGVTRRTQGTFGSPLVFNGSRRVPIPAAASLHLATAMPLEA